MRSLLASLTPGLIAFGATLVGHRMGYRRGKRDATPGPYAWECIQPDCAFSCRGSDMETVMRFADIHSKWHPS